MSLIMANRIPREAALPGRARPIKKPIRKQRHPAQAQHAGNPARMPKKLNRLYTSIMYPSSVEVFRDSYILQNMF